MPVRGLSGDILAFEEAGGAFVEREVYSGSEIARSVLGADHARPIEAVLARGW